MPGSAQKPLRVVLNFRETLIFVHRWMGVSFCLLFLLWFLSGFVMMYRSYPEVTAADRLSRAPVLDTSRIRLSPQEAYTSLQTQEAPSAVRLGMFDGRPLYKFGFGGDELLVYADTGQMQNDFPSEMTLRIASAWSGQQPGIAKIEENMEEDQWTVSGEFRALRPILKYTWPDGEEVYVSTVTGEVVQYTTRASRVAAYFGAIPHWLYFTPLRKHASEWTWLIVGASGLGTVGALLGMIVGATIYSPSKRFRYKGVPSSIPYVGPKRWHSILGLMFGSLACSWAFSGMLSMDPFPELQHGREDPTARLATALHGGSIPLREFADKLPREAVAQAGFEFPAKELELTLFSGEPVYLARAAQNETKIIPVRGESRSEFDRDTIIEEIKKAVRPSVVVEYKLITEYDAYYRDRHKRLPLPVIFVRLNDDDRSTYYIDPKTAQILQSYNSRSRWNRWIYHGLHSIDFPLLYKHRPAWDIVVLLSLLGGTSLCITSLYLAAGVLRRTMSTIIADRL